MFCPNCGAQNNDDAVFCAECGASLGTDAAAPQSKKRGIFKKFKDLSKNKKIGIIAVAAALLAGLTLLGILLFGNTWQKTAKRYVQNSLDGKWVKAASYFPKQVYNYDLKENWDNDKKDYNENLKDSAEDFLEDLGDSKIKIKSVTIVGYRDEHSDTVESRNDSFDSRYDIRLNITEIKTAFVRVEYRSGSSSNLKYGTTEVELWKIGGKWTVAIGSGYGSKLSISDYLKSTFGYYY